MYIFFVILYTYIILHIYVVPTLNIIVTSKNLNILKDYFITNIYILTRFVYYLFVCCFFFYRGLLAVQCLPCRERLLSHHEYKLQGSQVVTLINKITFLH